MEYWVASWEWRMEIALRKDSWQMGLPKVYLPCSGRPWQNRRWKLFLASKSRTLFLHLSCMVVFVVSFPVAVINSHC